MKKNQIEVGKEKQSAKQTNHKSIMIFNQFGWLYINKSVASILDQLQCYSFFKHHIGFNFREINLCYKKINYKKKYCLIKESQRQQKKLFKLTIFRLAGSQIYLIDLFQATAGMFLDFQYRWSYACLMFLISKNLSNLSPALQKMNIFLRMLIFWVFDSQKMFRMANLKRV